MTAISLTIASVPDQDELVAELWLGEEQVGEVSKAAEGGLRVELFPAPSGTSWRFRLDDLVAALGEAKERLGSA